jgi:hypothetical protein
MAQLTIRPLRLLVAAGCLVVPSSCGLLIDLPAPSDGHSGSANLGGTDGTDTGGANSGGRSVGGTGGDTPTSGGGGADDLGAAGSAGSPPGGGGGDSGGAASSGGASSGGSGGCANSCNCDSDPVDGPQCGGDDCDDDDPEVFPGQTEFFSTPANDAVIGYDYDCSDEIERPGSQVALVCDAVSLTKCDDYQGFLGDVPACGATGSWGTCLQGTLSCQEDVLDQEKVATCH